MRLRRTSAGTLGIILALLVQSGCTNMIESLEGSIELVSTNPSVPSNDPDGKILIRGTAWENVDVIEFYTGASCDSEPLSSVTRADFESGSTLTWPTNTQFEVYVQPLLQGGARGMCKKLFDYANDTTAPDNPIFSGFSVNGGNITALASINIPTVTSLKVAGQGVSVDDQISIHSNSTCSNEIGSGSGKEFMSVGVEVASSHVAAIRNAGLSGFYGRSQDLAGNASPCVLLSNLNYDTIAPSLSFTTPTPNSIISLSGCLVSRTVGGSCNESGRSVSIYLVTGGVQQAEVVTTTCSGGSFSASVSVSGVDLQSFSPRAVLSDQAGNTTTLTSTGTFKLSCSGGGGGGGGLDDFSGGEVLGVLGDGAPLD